MKKILWATLLFCGSAFAQIDTISGESQMTFSLNKWEQNQNEIPNKITKVARLEILQKNPQTSADMLSQTGAVFVQKSQLGGGSPMIRGFATNRVLIVVDGVRMNNAIYRSGNLQNVISIDALSTETAEVVFGPGSLVYGSDAIGGVMDFHSLEAVLQPAGVQGWRSKGSAQVRYSTANRERTAHADFSIGNQRFSALTSVTFSQFDDLKMGKRGGQDGYLRPEYVERINDADVVVKNDDPRRQVSTGYQQWNVLQKFRYKASADLDLQYAFYYGGTGDAPRYDRLTQYRNGQLRFAEWHYGPMLWRMHTLSALFTKSNAIFDRVKMVAAYQNYEESRIDRTRNRPSRNSQAEKVDAYTLNLDAVKDGSRGEWFYGAEMVLNTVGSMGFTENISSGATQPIASRYPNGSTWNTVGAYLSRQQELSERLTFNGGLRYSYGWVDAQFDQSLFPFPYENASIRDGGLTGNIGLVLRPASGWQVNGNISTGFRLPNIDDLGKLFESAPGNVTVPNPDLTSEYAWNFEIGLVKNKPGHHRFELNLFHTLLNDAIVRRPFQFAGQDSILFDGVNSRVEALQNIGKATVWGAQLAAEIWLLPSLRFYTTANYTYGRETDDVRDEQVPLRHAPPFFGQTGLRWQKGKLGLEAWSEYNSEISADELAPSEQPKTNIYAIDENGRPYSPGWLTLNTRANYQWGKWLLSLAWENMTNQRYRPYSSGVVAPGSNLVVSVRIGW